MHPKWPILLDFIIYIFIIDPHLKLNLKEFGRFMKRFLFVFLSIFLAFLLINKSIAADTNIATGATENTSGGSFSNGHSVSFVGISGGTLNVNHVGSLGTADILNESSNGTNNIGHIEFTNIGELDIDGVVGTSTSLIDKITLTSSSTVVFNDEINVANGVITDTDNAGSIRFAGIGDGFLVNSVIGGDGLGASGNYFNNIDITNDNGGTITFNNNIFTNITQISANNTMHILSSATDVNLGTLTLSQASTSLILDTDANAASYSSGSTASLTIANGKALNISGGASTLNGAATFGIDYSASESFTSNAAVTVTDGMELTFDYSNATDLNVGDHTFLSTTNTLTANDPNSYQISDNSILLKSTVSKNSETLVLSNVLDEDVTILLGEEETYHMNYLLDDSLGSTIRTELLKIQDQETLEVSLDSLEQERNNMVQTTSLDISNRVQDVINYRTMALNYNYIGFSSGNEQRRRGSIWGEVFGGYVSQDERLDEEGYTSTLGGAVFGGDGVIRGSSIDTTVGLAVSYANANVKGDSMASQNTDINSYQVTLYNNIVASNGMGLFSESSVTAGYNQYESSRNITVGAISEMANADYNGTQFSAKTGLGYNFKFANKLFLSPNVSIKYSSLTLEDYTETGAGDYGLEVENEIFDTVSTDLGLRVMGQIDTGSSNYDIFPQVNLSWTRNLDTDGREVETSFIGGTDTQKNVGIDLIENIFNAGLQFNIESKDSASFIIKYELQGAKDYLGHLGSIRYRLAF